MLSPSAAFHAFDCGFVWLARVQSQAIDTILLAGNWLNLNQAVQ